VQSWTFGIQQEILRNTVVEGAAARFGYRVEQVELRLYVGKFAGDKSGSERSSRDRQGKSAAPLLVNNCIIETFCGRCAYLI
jgi:hypothetical protein